MPASRLIIRSRTACRALALSVGTAGLATLGIYQEEGLLHRAESLEADWQAAIHSLRGLTHVVDIRTIGLIAGIELQPRADAIGTRAYDVFVKAFDKGVLTRVTGDIIALSPPLTIETGGDRPNRFHFARRSLENPMILAGKRFCAIIDQSTLGRHIKFSRSTFTLGAWDVKTEDLIHLLSEDTSRPINLSRALFMATSGGAVLAAAAFFSTLGLRHDIGEAVETVRFVFKFFVTLSLFGAAVSLVGVTIRPGSNPHGRRWPLMVAPVLLLAAVLVELYVTPSSQWTEKMIGHNALHCMTIIPVLSLIPAVPLFLVMRNGAPENPGIAGAIAGLTSAGIAATLYASNCFDDSPLFVATWYPLATLLAAAVGFFSGRRWLRW